MKDLPAKTLTLKSFFSGVIFAFSLFPFGLAVFCFFSRYLHTAELVNNFRAQIFVALFIAFVLCGIVGWRKWSIALLLAGIVLVVPVARTFLSADNPSPGPKTIKLMSINVLATNDDRQPTIELFKNVDPDILVVIEYSDEWAEVLQQINGRYPHQILKPKYHGFGLAIFSKYPLSNSNVVQLTPRETDNVFATTMVKVDDQQFRLAAAHLISPLEKLKMEIRNRQIIEVTQMLKWTEDPLVLVGDFNSTPWSPYMRDMLRLTKLRDSRQGVGYQGSWPTGKPLFRIPIDHAFVSEEVHIAGRKLLDALGSDHFPLVVEFSISK